MEWNLPENKLIAVNGISTQIRSGEHLVIEKNEEGKYVAELQKDELIEEINSAGGTINGSLAGAMNGEKVPAGIVANFINIFPTASISAATLKRRQIRNHLPELHYPRRRSGQKRQHPVCVAHARQNKIDLYRFKDKSGNVDYYDAKGYAMKKTLSRKPMSYQNARISSPFGRRRHPIYKDYRVHWGVDYAAPRNTLVYAAGDGVIQVAKYNGGYGNYIKIRHNSEYSTAYGHMQKFAKGIRPGVRVKQGQVIGYVGSTGRSTGPHLHYEVVKTANGSIR